MKSKLMVLLLFVVTIFGCCSYAAVPNHNKNWTCGFNKETAVPFSKSKSLDYFKTNILLPSRFYNELVVNHVFDEHKKLMGSINLVGVVHKRRIYEVVYNLKDEAHDIIKLIIVEHQENRYTPIYSMYTSTDGVEIFPAEIVTTKYKNKILSILCHYDGTGNCVDETYFLLDCYPPQILNLENIRDDVLKKVLPKGDYIHGYITNLETLTCTSLVWKENDAPHFPTDGWITIRYMIKNNKISVLDYRYDKNRHEY